MEKRLVAAAAAAILLLSSSLPEAQTASGRPASAPQRTLAPIPLEEAIRRETVFVMEPSPDRSLLAFTLSESWRRQRSAGAWFLPSGLPSGFSGVRVRLADVRTGRIDAIADDPEGRWASWAPSWSPDGAWLAFVSNRDGSPRIWRWERRTGRITRVSDVIVVDPSRRLTKEKWRPLQWTPDGRTIVARVLPEDMDTQALARYSSYAVRSGGRELIPDDRPTATAYPHVAGTADAANRKPGEADAVLMRRHHHFLGDIAAVRVDTGNVTRLARRAHAERYDLAPDGEHLAVHDVNTLRIVSMETRREVATDKSDLDVLPNVELTWAADSAAVLHVVRGVRRRVSIAGSVESVTSAPDAAPAPPPIAAASAHDRARALAAATGQAQFYRYEDATHYPNIWVAEPTAPAVRQLTNAGAAFGRYELGEQRLIEWITDDGDRRRGVLLLPAGYRANTRVPLIVSVYGGTTSVMPKLEAFGVEGRDGNMQIFATRGYAVLVPESKLRIGTPMLDLAKNVLPGVSKVVELGIADERRLGVMGHSYGGYSTLALITQTPRFRAAIAYAGVSNLTSYWGADWDDGDSQSILWAESAGSQGQGHMGASPWQARSAYIENSPFFYLDRVETPLLLIHGDVDPVPVLQSDQAYFALRSLGKTVEYARYTNVGHSMTDPANVRDLWERRLAWFDRYLKAAPSDRSQ